MPSERIQRRIESLLDEADEAVGRKDWEAVKAACDAVLRLDPKNEDARVFLDATHRDTGVLSDSTLVTAPVPVDLAPVPDSDTPTSFASGRYTVSKFLGEGGKKKVYLAHDNTLDRDVAFALIKTEGLDETSRERVKREAQAMGRMGTHPCIMPIYDLGEEVVGTSTQPYMVQPLMGGGDVEGLIEDADGPLALEDAIRIAQQTAQGLVFAHSKGIVHRDLKPGNIWLDEDGAAKIGDFGLAVATDRSRLTVEKVMVGTVSYMPPEQATGGEVTPKADFYSLGAMLYEMCTGRVPFMADDDIGVISQHINTPPVAPSWHNTQIPKTLDSLILRLLAKDPSERPADADEVLAALKSVDLTAVEEREDGAGSLDSMASGVFVGRHREMDQLKATFEEVLSGKGRMVTIVGEPGIGKTRTAQELATCASMRGAEVLWGRSYESGGAPPYWPWVQAIRSHVAATDETALRAQLGSTAPVIAELVSDLKAKLTDIPAPTPIEDPESARFRLFDSISIFFKNTAAATPLVLMLEDLHWSDKPSLMLLEFFARELANSRILIIGNYRDMELNRRHPLSVTLGDLSRERLFERVVLRGLQKHDVQRFIEIAAGISPPTALVDTVYRQTEGNPLFVTETVRLLIQEGDITSGQSSKAGTTSWEIRIPEGVREVIGRRLDRLSERCNEVLTIAAVVGRQFRFDVLKMLAEDTTDGQLLDAMDEALSARIIEELPSEAGFYQFTHASMQETLTGELSANRRVRMHARIAEALEKHYGNEAEDHATELAEHFAEAETVLGAEKLIHYVQQAGFHALESYSNEEAFRWFEIGMEAARPLPVSKDIADIWAGWGIAGQRIFIRQDRPKTVEPLTRALNFYEKTSDAKAAFRVGSAVQELHMEEYGGTDLVRRALLLQPASSRESLRLRSRLGRVLGVSQVRETQAAIDDLKLLLKDAEASDDRSLEARVLGDLARVMWGYSGSEEMLEYVERALELAIESEDIGIVSEAGFIATGMSITFGRHGDAIRFSELGFDASSKLRDRVRLSGGYCALIMAHRSVGLLKKARSYVEAALENDSQDGRVLAACSEVLYELGEVERADELGTQLFEICQQYNSPLDIFSLQILMLSRVRTSGRLSGFERALSWTKETAVQSDAPKGNFVSLRTDVLPITIMVGTETGGSVSPEALNAAVDGLRDWKFRFFPQGGPTKSALGRLLRLEGDIDGAAISFVGAINDCRDSGAQVDLAHACAEFADLLTDRDAHGDRDRATGLEDEAISIATELGMKPLLERVLAKREILKA